MVTDLSTLVEMTRVISRKERIMKLLDDKLFEAIEVEAKASPRLRMNYDLRTQAMDEDPNWRDCSQRMLNVMMKDTVIPIHRHTETSETVIVLRGSGDEVTYDSAGNELARVTLKAGSACAAVQVQMRGVTPKAPFKGGCNRSSCRSYIKEPSGHQSPGVVEMTRNGIEMTRNLS